MPLRNGSLHSETVSFVNRPRRRPRSRARRGPSRRTAGAIGLAGARHVRAHCSAVAVRVILVLDPHVGRRGLSPETARRRLRHRRRRCRRHGRTRRRRSRRRPEAGRFCEIGPGTIPRPATTASASSTFPLSSRTEKRRPRAPPPNVLTREHLDAVAAVEVVHGRPCRRGRAALLSRLRGRRSAPSSPPIERGCELGADEAAAEHDDSRGRRERAQLPEVGQPAEVDDLAARVPGKPARRASRRQQQSLVAVGLALASVTVRMLRSSATVAAEMQLDAEVGGAAPDRRLVLPCHNAFESGGRL